MWGIEYKLSQMGKDKGIDAERQSQKSIQGMMCTSRQGFMKRVVEPNIELGVHSWFCWLCAGIALKQSQNVSVKGESYRLF